MPGNSGHCDLCALPPPQQPVLRILDGEQKHFCCEGCARVYEVARDTGMLEQVLQSAHAREAGSLAPKRERPALLRHNESAFFDINGMWCAGCAVAAERVLRNRPGIRDVSISFAAERGRIEYDPEQVDPQAVMKVLTPLGYNARITSSKEEQQKERFQNRVGLQLMAATAFSMEIMVLYLVQLYPLYARGLYDSVEARRIQYLVWAMTTPVVFYGGLTFLAGAWRSLRARTVGMDTLVALGVLASYFYSAYVTITGNGQPYFDSASMIVNFILIGRYLEAAGGAQARKDLRSLLRLQPEYAWRREAAGGWQQVRVELLSAGDTILIKPGERVPADADVMEGDATLDESLLTGESLPVTKRPGDLVYAGTVIREGALTCRVVHPPGTTRLSQITELVSRTLSQKPRIQRLADSASAYLAYAIILLSALTFAGWFLRTHSAPAAVMAAVAVLVVACPCALGLATPLAMTVTMGHAARNGILVRSPEALETSAFVQRMVFDKTGTLTRGQLAVTEVVPAAGTGLDQATLLCLAASVEQFSEHPVARAIVQAAAPGPLLPARDFFSVRGAGASALVGATGAAQRVSVGSDRLVSPTGNRTLGDAAGQRAALGETVIWIDRDGILAGFISLRDQPNPTATQALQRLAKADVDTVMLSGDSALAAGAMANELAIGSYEGSCSPEEKAARISAWQQDGGRVGMVGDGVNDAPALAQANLSITVAGGTDIAGQASDLVLTRSDLRLIPWFFQLSRRTRRTIIQNLGWAFAYNLVAVPLAMLGLITPVIAAVAMAISSILVVLNSLRLRRL